MHRTHVAQDARGSITLSTHAGGMHNLSHSVCIYMLYNVGFVSHYDFKFNRVDVSVLENLFQILIVMKQEKCLTSGLGSTVG